MKWFPFTWKRPSAAQTATRLCGRQGAIPTLERLEDRLHPAVVTPFVPPRFSTIAHGNIAIIGNTVLTVPASNPAAGNAQNGVGSLVDESQFNPMAYVDVDSNVATFDSSSATLNMPAGSTVLFAGLYWGGFGKGTSDTQNATVLLAPPTSGGAYTTLVGTISGKGPKSEYGAFKDVTSQVQAAGNGVYTAANIQTNPTATTKRYGGWVLVVVYGNPADPPRSLTVHDGFATVPAKTAVPIPINGFTTPPSGPVNAQLGFVSYDGSLGKSGDSLRLNGNTLSDATRPANNFFNSSITALGTPVTAKNPNYVNQTGFDVGTVIADGDLPNGATSTTLG